eukprot:jgi/Botrbrau1/23546/Bobra.0141s0017.1
MGMERTLDSFDTEWYELQEKGLLPGMSPEGEEVPNQYAANLALQEHVTELKRELAEARKVAAAASATWDRFRKERDFHRMHHKRVLQEKNRLITDIERLKRHYSKYEPAIDELHHKYEAAMKEKMLLRLDRDRLAARVEALEGQLRECGPLFQGTMAGPGTLGAPKASPPAQGSPSPQKRPSKGKPSPAKDVPRKASRPPGPALPTGCRENPLANVAVPAAPIQGFTLQKTYRGHQMAVGALAMHPRKPIVVTASDDHTWKMWNVPRGDLIMCGEGHSDWLSGVDFHPQGSILGSSSGDATVKIWNFEKQACVATLTEHSKPVWGVAFHDQGDFLVSCSLDHTARLWDVASARCRQSFKGHVDSINSVAWQPYSGNLCTASTDKTVSVWDARSGLCAQTYYGHTNSCNSALFNYQGTHIASTDAEGVVKLWDARMVAEVQSIHLGPQAANKAVFDRSGTVLAVASDSGKVHVVLLGGGAPATPDQPPLQLTGHDSEVQALALSPAGDLLVTGGADHTFRVWA